MKRRVGEGMLVLLFTCALVVVLGPGCSWFRGGQETGELGAGVGPSRPDSVPVEPSGVFPESPKSLTVEISPSTDLQPAQSPPAAEEFPSKLVKITGKVLDERSNPLANAHVAVEATRFGSATFGSGRFYILDVPAGTYRLKLSKSGYADVVIDSVVVSAAVTTNVRDARLTSLASTPGRATIVRQLPPPRLPPTRSPSTTGKIVGKVVQQDGSPLAYVNVMVEGTAMGSAADERGEFIIIGVPPGTWRVRVAMMGFADTVLDSVAVSADLTTTVGPISMVEKRLAGGMDAIEVPAKRQRIDVDETGTSSIIEGDRVHVRGGRSNEVVHLVDGMKVSKPGAVWAPTPTPPPPPTGSVASRLAGTKSPDDWRLTALSPTTELWIIERSDGSEITSEYAAPQLKAVLPGKTEEIPLPLRHTDVHGRVDAFIATVDVRQGYHNPYQEKIEAVYVFPLPSTAAVTDFLMIIGDRKIRGMIREREEAQRIYEEAKAQGYRAALLSQERPNVFTQRVANIEPGNDIDVQTTFFMPLEYDDGAYEFVFPTVVGPRFNPPGYDKGIGAVVRGSKGISGQPVEVEYLKPGEMSGHDVSIQVDIDAGVTLEEVKSPTHAIVVERPAKSRAVVRLNPNDRIPDKDFVLRYRTAGGATKTALMVDRGDKGDYFALFLQPPASLADLPRMPREMVFVLDCSGSMNGAPLAKAKEAMRRCLKNLDPNDTFQIIRFSSNASQLGPAPIPATPENVMRGLRHVDELRSEGGTMMIEGIKTALDFPHDPGRFRIVSFMTDGYIGNEAEIFAAVHEKVKDARIFSFGVGSSVNRYLLEGLARLGCGAVAYIGLNEAAGDKVDLFYERMSRPALTDVEIDWGGLEVSDVYPSKIPDLFVGRPVILTGRFKRVGKDPILMYGRMGSTMSRYAIPLPSDEALTEHAGIRSVWARWKLADLSDKEVSWPSDELKSEITQVSLQHRLLCQYTSFVAVDGTEQTEGEAVTVKVPSYVPEGVKYETTVMDPSGQGVPPSKP